MARPLGVAGRCSPAAARRPTTADLTVKGAARAPGRAVETPDVAELARVAAHTGNGNGGTGNGGPERGAGPRGDEFGRPDVPFGDGWWN